MTEPDVTLTDFGLAAECAICAVLLGFTPARAMRLRKAGLCFFVFHGLAAAAGGVVHGFCRDTRSLECRILWQLALLSIGLAACSAWIVASGILASGHVGHWLALAGIPQLAVFTATVLLFTREFWVAFTIYLPAALLLLAAFCRACWQGHRFVLVGVSGVVLSFVSSFIQFMRIGVHPVYFNHNALAHVVQAVALALMFLGIRAVVGSALPEWRAVPATAVTPPSG
jgi:hypothetical protein